MIDILQFFQQTAVYTKKCSPNANDFFFTAHGGDREGVKYDPVRGGDPWPRNPVTTIGIIAVVSSGSGPRVNGR